MFDFDSLSHAIASQTVLCVGDLMLDEFVYGEVSRISPEAPAPVIAVAAQRDQYRRRRQRRAQYRLARRTLYFCRHDRRGRGGREAGGRRWRSSPASKACWFTIPSRPTTRKVRFVSEHFSTHMLRADWELAHPATGEIEQKLIDAALPQIARADIVLLSDYAKGVLTARVIRNVIDTAKKLGKRVIVDPKSANFAIYRGATLLTPNRKEFAEATRSRADSDRSIAEAAQDAMYLADCEAMLVTQSEHGMTLVTRAGEAIHVPALPVKVRDVSGAGDTVVAALSLALAAGADWEGALRTANAAAAVAVGKTGTAIVTPAELRRKILPTASLAAEEKIVAVGGDLETHLSEWRKQESARRLHQWLFRYSASRPRQGADGGAPCLRPADRRPQQRRIGAAPERRGPSRSGRARARGSAGGAGGGRSRRHLRGGYADRPDRRRSGRACW